MQKNRHPAVNQEAGVVKFKRWKSLLKLEMQHLTILVRQ